MLYESPRYRVAGDRHLLVELGNEVDLATNCKAIALAQALLRSQDLGPTGIGALLDIVPSFTTVLIQYAPRLITVQGLIQLCRYYLEQLAASPNWTLPSRLIEIPVAYCDRWTRACYEQYCQTIKPIEDNPTYLAHLNGLDSVESLIRYHSTPEWWVGAVGFMAGLPTLMPLDPDFKLDAPKYDPPRTWTPQGTIGVASSFTTIYPLQVPDGYQMIGRTPVPIFEPGHPAQELDPSFLFQLGDRVKFRPICEAEFDAIAAQVQTGTYQYRMSEPQDFCVGTILQRQSPELTLAAA